MADERLIEEACAIADRRPAATTSSSPGIRLLDRLSRLFGSSPDEPHAPSAGTLFLWGPLEVRRQIGAGSFGDVYEAWDPTLRREVALKLRSPETGALRWLDEARNLARVRHAHVVTVHGADVLDGRAGIWTERVVGRTLEDELVESGPFNEAETTRIGRDIASALSAVHAAGLIHGDVKPANIMLESGDAPRRAVLVDFGSADHQPSDDELPSYVMGTPLTMAPEVLDGKPASPAADVYGLGATLFRLLTGRYPVDAQSIDELQRAHRSKERAQVREFAPKVSARLARAVERALDPDPATRWPDAKSFQRALDDAADPTRRIRMRAVAVAAGIIAVAALSLIVYVRLHPESNPITRARLAAPENARAFVETWRRQGTETANAFGWVAAVVDVDHDGFRDVVGVEPRWKGKDGAVRGRVLVFRGSAHGVSDTPDMTIEGDVPGAELGYNVANAGDTDGDGFDELLVAQEPEKSEMFGRAELFARDASSGALVVKWTYTGHQNNSAAGDMLAGVGDVNGDGFGDVMVSESNAPDLQPEEGRMMLFLGSRHGLSPTPAWTARGGKPYSWMGTFTLPLGDMNGDGFNDVIVAASAWDDVDKNDCGQARIYLGSASGLSAEPVLTVEGNNTNSRLGDTVGGVGDVNHDGYADAMITEAFYSDERYPERGRVLLYLGGPHGPSTTPDWIMEGPVSYAHYGSSFRPLGDVDGDGFDDVAISCEQFSIGKRTHIGMVEVFRGSRQGLERTPLWRMTGDTTDCHFGRFVTSGDLDGDGVQDIVIAAPNWTDGTSVVGMLSAFTRAPRPR